MNTLVSIIIPVYNAEAWLQGCLNSVCNQTYSNIEIICIDDASSDKSVDILNEYAKLDKRIAIICNKENKGLSEVQNIGLDHAHGDWIIAIDSDDYFSPNAIETCLEHSDNETDIIVFKKRWFEDGNGKTIQIDSLPAKGKQKVTQTLLNCTSPHFKGKMWRLSFIRERGIRFIPHIWYEDKPFWFCLSPWCNHLYYLHETLYNYRCRENSIMAQTRKKHEKTLDQLTITETILKYWKEHNIREHFGEDPLNPLTIEVNLIQRLFWFTNDFSPKNKLHYIWIETKRIMETYGIINRLPEFPELSRFYHISPYCSNTLVANDNDYISPQDLVLLLNKKRITFNYFRYQFIYHITWGRRKIRYKNKCQHYRALIKRCKQIKNSIFKNSRFIIPDKKLSC